MSFNSLEVARQALFVQQSALHTTGHNIANANTEGYTRQRVNFEQAKAYPFASRNRPQIPGQIGTGVKSGSIERIRDNFLDVQYRTENSQAGYWQERASSLGRMEGLMNELSDTGLSASLGQFWTALEDLSANPDNTGARSVVIQRGEALADTFKHYSQSLTGFREDIKIEMANIADGENARVNTILEQINDINEQVNRLEPHGYTTNDLYDKRDLLIDELSGILNIEVTKNASSDSTLTAKTADGVVTIELVNSGGENIKLVDGEALTYEQLTLTTDKETVTGIQVGSQTLDAAGIDMLGNASLKAMFKLYNEDFPDMLAELDKMAYAFASEFNTIHQGGYTMDGQSGIAFFGSVDEEAGAASSLFVNVEDPSEIAAGTAPDSGAGDGGNIHKLLKIFDEPLVALDGASIYKFYEALIGGLAVKTEQANQMTESTNVLKAQVDRNRQSVSAVSLDEEMTNLIQFQHAYNAAARNITTIDEMLDRIINNMGLVGR